MRFFILFCFFNTSILMSQDIHHLVKEGTILEISTHISKNPSSINSVSSSGYTPLMLAAYYNKIDVIQFFLKNDVAINETSPYGTALMAAVVKGNKKIVQQLIEHKADLNLADENGSTALHLAALFNQIEIAKLLLEAGAQVHHTDIRGNKALDYAIIKQNELFITLINQYL